MCFSHWALSGVTTNKGRRVRKKKKGFPGKWVWLMDPMGKRHCGEGSSSSSHTDSVPPIELTVDNAYTLAGILQTSHKLKNHRGKKCCAMG